MRFYVDQAGQVYADGGFGSYAPVGIKKSGEPEYRTLYAVQSAAPSYEDFGTASLVNGVANVAIESLFAKTVNLSAGYHVYVTPLCSEAVLLFVTDKDSDGFTVQGVTLSGKASQCAFDYRIVAKPLGSENTRMEVLDQVKNPLTSAPENKEVD
jgi:hypothetical protein